MKKPRPGPPSVKQTRSGINHAAVGSLKSALLATLGVAAGACATAIALTLIAQLLQHGVQTISWSIELQAHHFFYAIIIALANNVDNLGARIAYSIQGTRVETLINVWISLITFIISSLATFSGAAAIDSFGKHFGSMIAMGILVTLGFWIIIQARRQSWHEKIH
jgi:putative sporulation protein YtaF